MDATDRENTAKMKRLEQAKEFAESWKAILSLLVFCVVTAGGAATWIWNNAAWASDIKRIETQITKNQATQATALKSASLDAQMRYLSSKIDDLSDQIFQLDHKISSAQRPDPNDIAFKNRLMHRRQALEGELRDAQRDKAALQ